MKVSKTGMSWFRESEYDELRKLFVDGNDLPRTYNEWLKLAENGFNKLRSQGHSVIKAYIHLATFPDWCKARGLEVNSKARVRFAAEFARDHVDD